jgi:hypothetical protein
VNWALLATGVMGLAAAAIHGIVGDRIVRRLDADKLGGNPFDAALSTKFLIRVSWHFVTIAFAGLGASLVVVGVTEDPAASTGVAYTAGVLFTSWAVFSLIVGYSRGGMRAWLVHPAPILLSLAAILSWWGATI